jgi:DNA repair protein RecN (Recombination protein N)
MIREISIRDLGVIRQTTLNFGPGLNVLTGETGAGKTMVLTALGLLMGERSDAAMIRAGAKQLLVEGVLRSHSDAVKQRVLDLGGELEGDELLLNRSVSPDKSRATVGGVNAPASALAEIGQHLLVVHGQSDQIRLKSPAAQREALDRFGHLGEDLQNYRVHYDAWRAAEAALQRLESNRQQSAVELEALKSDLEKFELVDPKVGEDLELDSKISRLENLESLRVAASIAHEALNSDSDSEDAIGLIERARRAVEGESRKDALLEQILEGLNQSMFDLRDLAANLSSYLAQLEGDEEIRLEAAQARKAQLLSLTRKFGPTLEEVFQWEQQAQMRLLDLDDSTERLEALLQEISNERALAQKLADQITAKRKLAAEQLGAEVTLELQALAMKDARLVVTVDVGEALGAHGQDVVSIMLASYPGAEPRSIGKGASGGELSRIMLAIEVVLAKDSNVPTFVFDEVDAGVGGAAAIEVGKRLARLAKQAQVIVVTHLAQVAAFADVHLRVTKAADASVTESDVQNLDQAAREVELARMLSGLAESENARANAAELMSLAKQGL